MKANRIERVKKAPPWSAAVVLAVSMVAWVSCSKEDTPTAPPPVPKVNSVTPATVVPGDTVTIGGADFATPHDDNKVYFNNPLRAARPFAGSKSSLQVVVPEDAATGPVRVSVPEQPQAGVGPEVSVTRGVGDVWVFAGTGTSYPLRLPFPGGNSEYLLVPHSANAAAPYTQVHEYTFASGEAPSPSPASAPRSAGRPMMSVRERFDQRLRRYTEGLLREADASDLTGRDRIGRGARAPQAPAQFRQFNVLSNAMVTTVNPADYTQVTAELRYEGDFCLIYNDVDTLATGNFTQGDFDDMGTFFDTQGYPSDTLYFGRESDVDGNGKVIVLVSGIINGLAATDAAWDSTYYIGGFFLPVDLFEAGTSHVPEGTTNEAEIFYTLAADPSGQYLPPVSFPRTRTVEENKQTLVHEFQHLISFSYRIFNFGLNAGQQTWLEEGMAHMAEDLVGRNDGNVERANDYLADPDTVSLEDDRAPIEQRGGIYLFLRYLGDRFGEGIYKRILQSSCAGRSCIENITGENFYDTFADFMATLYLSGRGITSDPRYNFVSIDLGDFRSLKVGSGVVGGPPRSGDVFRTSGDFYLITNPGGSEGEFTFTQSSGMGLRSVVVRTR
jgi:hypothetical protein